MSMQRFLTIDDLIDAFIEEFRFRNAHQDLRDYYTQRLDLLMKLFKCDLDKRRRELDEILLRRMQRDNSRSLSTRHDINGTGTIVLLENCIAAQSRTKSPFRMTVYLESAPPKIVRELEKKYGRRVNEHEQALDQLSRLVAKEILKFLFPRIDRKKIPQAKLFEMGLPKEAPDPDDHW
jgi:hypothetical protein